MAPIKRLNKLKVVPILLAFEWWPIIVKAISEWISKKIIMTKLMITSEQVKLPRQIAFLSQKLTNNICILHANVLISFKNKCMMTDTRQMIRIFNGKKKQPSDWNSASKPPLGTINGMNTWQIVKQSTGRWIENLINKTQ